MAALDHGQSSRAAMRFSHMRNDLLQRNINTRLFRRIDPPAPTA
jgi:hypothetical protein